MLYVPALALAKVSLVVYLFQLTPHSHFYRLNTAVMWAIVVWAVVSVFAIAFQCRAPQTWAILSDQCFDQPAFWDVVGTFDILSELVIVALPVFIVAKLQMASNRKAAVIGAFASRLLYVARAVIVARSPSDLMQGGAGHRVPSGLHHRRLDLARPHL